MMGELMPLIVFLIYPALKNILKHGMRNTSIVLTEQI